jgi:hypothetical protein
MKVDATLILPAICCLAMLAPACAMRAAKATPPPPTPAASPQPVAEAAGNEPISVPQTQVVLPSPQPIQAEALAVAPPELPTTPEHPSQTARPRAPAAPKSEPKPQVAVQPPAATPVGPQPPPANPPASRKRIRPVESAAARKRLLVEIGSRQQKAQDFLAKAKTRQLSDAEKGTVERIQAFLEQTDAALKDQDLQQAEALSSRALILCQELSPEK